MSARKDGIHRKFKKDPEQLELILEEIEYQEMEAKYESDEWLKRSTEELNRSLLRLIFPQHYRYST